MMKEKRGLRMVRWGQHIFVGLSLLAGLLVGTAVSAQPAPERRIEYQGPIAYGERVIGPLQPDVVAQVWEFQGSQGDEVAIAMNALTEELDPYLLLLRLDDAQLEELFALGDDELADLESATAERGLLLDLNDDRGEDTNALISTFVLPSDGRYAILATSCCTGDSTGRYELILDFLGNQGPGGPEQPAPQLRDFAPPEGQAGTEMELILTGDDLPALGGPLGLVLGGIEIPILDVELVDDQTLVMSVLLPAETPPGEQEISFFFENGGLDGLFLVRAQEGGGPGGAALDPTDVPPLVDPDPIIQPPEFPWWILILISPIVLLGAAGAVAWRLLRRRPPSSPPSETPPQPPAAPQVRFELHRDAGRQSLQTSGGSLRAAVDIRFKLRRGQSRQEVDDDGTSLTA